MAYNTLAEYEAVANATQLGRLTDDPNGTTHSDAVIIAAQKSIYQLINLYIGARYVTPLSPCPDIVKDWENELVSWKLMQRNVDDARKTDTYQMYMNELEGFATSGNKGLLAKVRDGEFDLPGCDAQLKEIKSCQQYEQLDIPTQSLADDDTDIGFEEKE